MKTTQQLLRTILLVLSLIVASLSWSQSEAIYNITVTTNWNATDHTTVPGSAHWSNLVGATHSTPNKFMSIGNLASTGIKNVAEFGSNAAIKTEINDAINIDGDADQLLEDTAGFLPFGAIGTSGFTNLTVSADFPLVSLVSMVAPSPDWFIAVNSESLRTGNPAINNGWKDDYTIDVFAYDSGTDDGLDYTSANAPSTPFVNISMVSSAPINGIRMATITFDYQSSTLGMESQDSVEEIKVYPNPAKDVLTISNTMNGTHSVALYNILGKRIKDMKSVSSNPITMNVKDLYSGIYILKIRNPYGDTTTRKIIIE